MARDVLYLSPRQVFEAFKACPRLREVGHFWDKIEEKPARVGPRAVWQMTDVQPTPPRQPRYVALLPDAKTGQKRSFTAECKADALCSVAVDLFAEVNGKPDGWGLFSLYVLAAAEVLRVEADYSLRASTPARESLSTATDLYRCVLSFRIPILELHPNAVVEDDAVSLAGAT